MAGNATHQLAVLGAIGNGRLTLDDLAAHLPMSRRSITGAVGKLVVRDLVERMERAQYRVSATGLVVLAEGEKLSSGPRGKLARPLRRPTTLRQRAWNAMRIRVRFTIADLAMLAATEGNLNAEISIGQYVRGLAAAGYVDQRAGRAKGAADPLTSNGWKVWQLVRDTGPNAPVVRLLTRDIYDFNLDEAVPCRA